MIPRVGAVAIHVVHQHLKARTVSIFVGLQSLARSSLLLCRSTGTIIQAFDKLASCLNITTALLAVLGSVFVFFKPQRGVRTVSVVRDKDEIDSGWPLWPLIPQSRRAGCHLQLNHCPRNVYLRERLRRPRECDVFASVSMSERKQLMLEKHHQTMQWIKGFLSQRP